MQQLKHWWNAVCPVAKVRFPSFSTIRFYSSFTWRFLRCFCMGHLKWVEFSTSLLHYSHPRSCALAKRKVCKIHHPCMLCGGCQGLRGLCFVWQWLWGIPTPKSPETRVVPLWHPSIPEDRKVAMQDHTSPLHIIHLPIVSHSQSLYESYTVAFFNIHNQSWYTHVWLLCITATYSYHTYHHDFTGYPTAGVG